MVKKGKTEVKDKKTDNLEVSQQNLENNNEDKVEKDAVEKPSPEEELKTKLQDLEEKNKELQDKYLRLSAEFDNYRKRTLKEKMEMTKSAGEAILLNILPVVDDFERAVKNISEAKDVEPVKEGINLIYNKFKEFLTQNGVKEIETESKEFNLDLHEAVTKIPAPAEELKGKIVDVIKKGYLLNDKVMRYSKVVVGE